MGRLFANSMQVICIFVALSSAAVAADWGTIRGRFVFDGPVPDRPTLAINKDIEFCGKHEPRSEKLLVHGDDRGIANVVIWLDSAAGKELTVHPSFAASAEGKIKLANKGCRFDPHICVLRTGQTLVIQNPDAVDHNTAAGLDRNQPFNDLTPMGKSSERPRFTQPEKLPAQVQCSIHPWMTGWLVIKDHPYVAVTDEHGRFEIKNLPTGNHTFVVWHELPGLVQRVTREGKSESWKRGKVMRHVAEGENDLGEMLVTADDLK